MITQEKILANAKKYFTTAEKYGFMTEELTSFLGEDFIKAPASPLASYNNAFEGGLIDHLLRVGKYAIDFNNALPEDERQDVASLLRVALIHQIGNAKSFTPCTSQWHKDNQGKMYEYVDTDVSMYAGSRSLYYAMSSGVKLTEEEFAAVIFLDMPYSKMGVSHNSYIGELLKMAITFATKHEQRIYQLANEEGKKASKKVKEKIAE